jgi:hypothetical protein
MRENIEFRTGDGTTLRGWLTRPSGAAAAPSSSWRTASPP